MIQRTLTVRLRAAWQPTRTSSTRVSIFRALSECCIRCPNTTSASSGPQLLTSSAAYTLWFQALPQRQSEALSSCKGMQAEDGDATFPADDSFWASNPEYHAPSIQSTAVNESHHRGFLHPFIFTLFLPSDIKAILGPHWGLEPFHAKEGLIYVMSRRNVSETVLECSQVDTQNVIQNSTFVEQASTFVRQASLQY